MNDFSWHCRYDPQIFVTGWPTQVVSLVLGCLLEAQSQSPLFNRRDDEQSNGIFGEQEVSRRESPREDDFWDWKARWVFGRRGILVVKTVSRNRGCESLGFG